MVRDLGRVMYTLKHLEWIINKGLLYSDGALLNVIWGSLDGRGSRGYRVHIYVWLSP